MGLEWTDKWNGWRSLIKLDLPAHSELYTSDNTMIKYSDVPPFRTGHKVTGDVSSCNVIVVGRDGHYILAGAVTAFRSQTILRALLEQHRITGIEAWQPDIRQGEEPEEMVILEGSDWRELLCQYADIAARKMGAKPIDAQKNMTGYCSWYYYYKDVSEANMLKTSMPSSPIKRRFLPNTSRSTTDSRPFRATGSISTKTGRRRLKRLLQKLQTAA